MSLSPGARLGPYEVVAPIGAGGMGEVYRARDTRLEREAKTISQLSHPHICAIHDVGEQDGVAYLVMELLEGETLAQRLAKGPLPLDQVMRVAVEIADALGRAHRQGIVHRDVKPANVMLTKSGTKLLDFGLAKAAAVATSGFSQLSKMATGVALGSPGTGPLTAEGTLVGTFQYMSPEQLDGRDVDGRSDIWAFGCVLYEMTTGSKAFAGSSQASLISAILRDEPKPMRDVLPLTPPALEHVVRTCLAKDPDERWQDAHDVARELLWISQAGGAAGKAVAATRSRRLRAPLLVALAALLAAALFGAGALSRRPASDARPLHASLAMADGVRLDALASLPVLSPDGRRLAFVGRDALGSASLQVRDLETGATQLVPGTSGASFAFWSPDGRSLAFFLYGAVQRVLIGGGAPERILETNWGFGGTWSKSGIVVATALNGGLTHLRPEDGSKTPATALDASRGERAHYWPSFLPDGRHFLFLCSRTDPATQRAENEVWVQELGKTTRTRLLLAGSNAVHAEPGYLLFLSQGDLVAQRFDAQRLNVVGDRIVLARGVSWHGDTGLGLLSAGAKRIVYIRGGAVGLSRLAVLDRKGATLERLGSPANHWTPRLSPDGARVAVELIDPATRNRDIVVYATSGSSPPVRVTFDPGEDFTPAWSPDGTRLAFSTDRKGEWSIRIREMTGGGRESELAKLKSGSMLVQWAPDGRRLSVNEPHAADYDTIQIDVASGTSAPLVATPRWERDAVLSPNGKWIAYVADESGRPEVYVVGIGPQGGKWQVSATGGRAPRWRRDGKELFYVGYTGNERDRLAGQPIRSSLPAVPVVIAQWPEGSVPESALMAVDVDTEGAFRAGAPRALFATPLRRTNIAQYDVFPDGQRFIVNVLASDETPAAVSLIDNWTAALGR